MKKRIGKTVSTKGKQETRTSFLFSIPVPITHYRLPITLFSPNSRRKPRDEQKNENLERKIQNGGVGSESKTKQKKTEQREYTLRRS